MLLLICWLDILTEHIWFCSDKHHKCLENVRCPTIILCSAVYVFQHEQFDLHDSQIIFVFWNIKTFRSLQPHNIGKPVGELSVSYCQTLEFHSINDSSLLKEPQAWVDRTFITLPQAAKTSQTFDSSGRDKKKKLSKPADQPSWICHLHWQERHVR